MADLQDEKIGSCDTDNIHNMGLSEVSQSNKRTKEWSPGSEPHQKSPRTLPNQSDILEGPADKNVCSTKEKIQDPLQGCAHGEGPAPSPHSRRKSWRRSARGRRSLPSLSSISQSLCKSISPSLPEEERLEKLMEASMQLTVERIQNTLHNTPGADLEVFQTQVESLRKEWRTLADDLNGNRHLSSSAATSDPHVQKAVEQMRRAISRLQDESSSWDSLMNKHKCKAEELAKRVEQGQERGIILDPDSVAQSSQSKLILSKPDYRSFLSRQQHVLSTVALLMDTQCKMVRELQCFQEQSHLLVKETSARLASDAGFQNLPHSPVRKLLKGPVTAVSTL